ncbi:MULTISPECIES: potassium-transporting ATPase subunit KdpC [Undibacterium]|jgi:K+-transporting ATPase ATPase C chain|uniref:Potassium-transporting ATPase KdpC subunit n=1 Tax=Undibacterium umbellatum TaxID=2762300 RepID=A0ABR6ZAP4_9BURK|nr:MULTISPECIES: potassium-transporting ATPase subunit KdpC [Undibacterium]MBC3908810.1 potassium-transporting ATPase subunit KdpC [Undibacterium umbellatum]MDP1978542.1 potassium-transporting ATPase subunit KdpC [Undibacterium sp.]
MSTSNSNFRPAVVLFAGLTLIVGVIYPFAMTGVGKVLFNEKAEGSLIVQDGKTVGSSLIGQSFSSPKYFWGRPSATGPMSNNAGGSSGSNLGPTNPALIDAVKGRIEALKAADPGNTAKIPVDLVTASASGLDPEISLAAANYQLARVARERKLPESQVKAIIDQLTQQPMLGLLGEARVNVLALNLALDKASK